MEHSSDPNDYDFELLLSIEDVRASYVTVLKHGLVLLSVQ